MRNLKKLSDALLNFEDKGLTVEAWDGNVYVSMENKLYSDPEAGQWEQRVVGHRGIGNVLQIIRTLQSLSKDIPTMFPHGKVPKRQ